MKRFKWVPILMLFFFSLVILTTLHAGALSKETAVSGTLVNGYRVLTIGAVHNDIHFRVYRGDYIRFAFPETLGEPVLRIPELGVEKELTSDSNNLPYFKMKTTGTFAFRLGDAQGAITVINYRQPNYRELTSDQAADFIREAKPLILDVRTKGEFDRGHLEDAVLIPVQTLQSRLEEIARYKNQEILIYCATGNRSTVASKILIDNGFKHISNMRFGIAHWVRQKYPVGT